MFNGRILTVGTVREHLLLTLLCRVELNMKKTDKQSPLKSYMTTLLHGLFLRGAASINIIMISLVMIYLRERNSRQTLHQEKLGVKSSWKAVKPPDTGPEHPLRL